MDVLSFCNGKNNEKDISNYTKLTLTKTLKILNFLKKESHKHFKIVMKK